MPCLPRFAPFLFHLYFSKLNISTSKVSQTWKRLSEDETLWRMLCKRRWGVKIKKHMGQVGREESCLCIGDSGFGSNCGPDTCITEYTAHYCYWKFQYWLYLCKNVWAQRVFDDEEVKNGRGTYSWSNGNCYEGMLCIFYRFLSYETSFS